MKISIASDLHLEFGWQGQLDNVDGSDVLVLAGGILTIKGIKTEATDGQIWHDYNRFIDHVSSQWNDVVVIAGNHEYYQANINETQLLRDFYNRWPNVHFLERDVVELYGLLIVGTTLWTNFNSFDYVAMDIAAGRMNCFSHISNGTVKFTPLESAIQHDYSKNYIRLMKPDIVVTHHLPSFRSIHPMYAGQMLNYAFASHLDRFIQDLQPKLWIHGHTNMPCDYYIDKTRVVCNPKGYPGEGRGIYKVKTIEV